MLPDPDRVTPDDRSGGTPVKSTCRRLVVVVAQVGADHDDGRLVLPQCVQHVSHSICLDLPDDDRDDGDLSTQGPLEKRQLHLDGVLAVVGGVRDDDTGQCRCDRARWFVDGDGAERRLEGAPAGQRHAVHEGEV